MNRRLWVAPLLIASMTRGARADVQPTCHVVTASFVPASQLQIVAWVEKPDGTYIETIYITKKTGHYGLGNRPGRFDFNSGPIVNDEWPYGRRITTFPVWAHRHGMTFPEVVFQNAAESNLSHPFMQSTQEPYYCRPLGSDADQASWDAGTCPTPFVGTDKGEFDPNGGTSLYPPRADIMRVCNSINCDSPSVAMYQQMDPFDAVAQATPVGGAPAAITWPIPSELPLGDYVLFVETSQAFDYNSTYNATSYPAPTGVEYGDLGVPYRGQPSIVYSVPFTIGTGDFMSSTQSYLGYGDPTGTTGTLNPPDATITADTPNSGASRFAIIPGSSDRIQVSAIDENDTTPPADPRALTSTSVASSSVTIQFIAPGDDGTIGMVTGYDVRYRTANAMTQDNFSDAQSMRVLATVTPVASGQLQSLEIDGLLPETQYWIGVQAYDKCHNTSDVAIISVNTTDRPAGYVDACFVASAAYGSRMAADVEPLRHFRDAMLESSVLGDLAVETYYTFGPSVAGVVGQSDLLRASARDVLAPIVARVRAAGL
ncbi:MAG TPA: CFI-box-CTERM domain-containing protein [Kofleriaceae bacterium]|nr:CFI-box-CTERM domain-containing protein [Kofleriaceae bacterium]